MLVVNISHDPLVITEYNGKRYCFRKGFPIDIDPKVYNNIILSGHISAEEIVIYQPMTIEIAKEEDENTITNKINKVVEKKIKMKKKKPRVRR